jgi:hypothetical protein
MKRIIIYLTLLTTVFAMAGCNVTDRNNSGEEDSMNQSEIIDNTSGTSVDPTASAVSQSEEDQQFYNQPTIHVTWLNVWDGSTEGWWTKESSSGTRVLYPGIDTETTSLNWGDSSNKLRKFYMDQVRDAGIDAVVLDLTNGVRWDSACTFIASYCKENNMRFAAAIHAGSAEDYETKARQVWTKYAAPTATYSGSYLQKDGKPLIVAYVGKMTWFNAIKGKELEVGSRFTSVWASGEDSWADKWGWQAPAADGPKPSEDSMYITPSINWTAPSWSITGWRRSLAYLDYGFLLARKSTPHYLIVGSFDDMRERNGWMIADTSEASFNHRVLVPLTEDKEGTPGLQMRNVEGEISSDAFYNRVQEWLTSGDASPFYPGGILPDGAYQMVNAYSGKGLTSENPSAYNPEDGKKPIDFTKDVAGVPLTQQAQPGYQQYMFLYHLGNNEYRIIRLCVGLSLEEQKGSVVVEWDGESAGQRWIAQKTGDRFVFINKATGKALAVSSKTSPAITAAKDTEDEKQQWVLTEIAVFGEQES